MNQQDLVWIRFPFSNLQDAKARPAIVVSQDAYNQEHDDVLICAVTANLSPAPYKVALSPDELSEGDLPLESMVRADKLVQVEKELVDRSFGRVDDAMYDRVVQAIHALVARPA